MENLTTNNDGNQVVGASSFAPMWSEEDKGLIHQTVAKGTTESEFKLFLYTAAKYKLDPLVKQVWCVKYGSAAASIFTGRDGFLSIAHRSGKFDGMETVSLKEDKKLTGARCTVYRTDMSHPFIVEVALSEYDTHKSNWSKMPETMIKKVAESQCLRKAFDISGLYAPEEYESAEQQHHIGPQAQNTVTKPQLSKIFALAGELDFPAENMKNTIHTKFGVSSSTKMTKKQASELIEEMETLKKARKAEEDVIEEEKTIVPTNVPNAKFEQEMNELCPPEDEE